MAIRPALNPAAAQGAAGETVKEASPADVIQAEMADLTVTAHERLFRKTMEKFDSALDAGNLQNATLLFQAMKELTSDAPFMAVGFFESAEGEWGGWE